MDVTRFFIYTYADEPNGEEHALEVCANDYTIAKARKDYPNCNFLRVEGPDIERLERKQAERMWRDFAG